MVNFGLRSKVFINRVQSLTDSKRDIEDVLFDSLFTMNYQELTESEALSHRVYGNDMSVYIAWFLKILIKTLQSSYPSFFNVTTIKQKIAELILNERLVVATNSLPMFLVVQMFFSTEQISKDDNAEITKRLFSFIKSQIEKVRKGYEGYKYPLLHFY